MDNDDFKIKITSDTRKINRFVTGQGSDGVTFNAKVFDKPSVFGIDAGRVSKLSIKKDYTLIANFDRGWDKEPDTPENKMIFEAVMAKLNGLDMTYSLDSGQKSLSEKLEEAKEKASLREFEVTITETLEMKVKVQAINRQEAEVLVSEKWNDSEYILSADNFTGVEFNAEPVKPERSHGKEERR